jgi:hypothetical protein
VIGQEKRVSQTGLKRLAFLLLIALILYVAGSGGV